MKNSDLDNVLRAVYSGDLVQLKNASSSCVRELRDEDGRTILMHAVLAENLSMEILRWLIEEGVDIDVRDRVKGSTALHFAARRQAMDVVQILLQEGAQVDATDDFGNTPLWTCVIDGQTDSDVVRVLLDAGADPRKKNNSGVSAMDLAAGSGDRELTALLSRPS